MSLLGDVSPLNSYKVKQGFKSECIFDGMSVWDAVHLPPITFEWLKGALESGAVRLKGTRAFTIGPAWKEEE